MKFITGQDNVWIFLIVLDGKKDSCNLVSLVKFVSKKKEQM